ncbi:MAG TPA: hypothetical protein VHC21_04440 [Candidatus Saccharimonadales bacterium]|nr:hypothetical protein [Candidatus Saccharimonadales bacterium]
MHPAKTGGETAAASNVHKTPGVKATVLAPLPLAQTTLPTLTPAPTSGSNSSSAASDATASPQAAGDSSPASGSPKVQSAVPNTASASPHAAIHAQSSSPVQVLTNLLGGLGL